MKKKTKEFTIQLAATFSLTSFVEIRLLCATSFGICFFHREVGYAIFPAYFKCYVCYVIKVSYEYGSLSELLLAFFYNLICMTEREY